jgi:hypothetical protein
MVTLAFGCLGVAEDSETNPGKTTSWEASASKTTYSGDTLFSRESLNAFTLLSFEATVGRVCSIPELPSRYLFYCPDAKYLYSF